MLRLARIEDYLGSAPVPLRTTRHVSTQSAPKIAVSGVTVMPMHFTSALAISFQDIGVTPAYPYPACPPVQNYTDAPRKSTISCEDFNSQVMEYLLNRNTHAIDTLLYSLRHNLAKPPLVELFKTTIEKLNEWTQNSNCKPNSSTCNMQTYLLKLRAVDTTLKDCQFDFQMPLILTHLEI